MSRPRLSVPSTCGAPMPAGAFIIAVSSCLFGSWGATAGPMMPIKIKIKTIEPPLNALTCKRGIRRGSGRASFSVADSRVNDCIKSIDNQIDRYEGQRISHDDTRHQRVVARIERGDEQAAAARPGENGLDDDRTAAQRAELHADDRAHRNDRVARPFAPHHAFLPHSLSS